MDLFSLMGLTPEEEEQKTPVTKKVKKDTAKKKDGVKFFSLPSKVVIPYHLPEILSVEGKNKITESELCEKYGSYLSWSELHDSSGESIMVGKFKLSDTIAKGSIDTSKDIKIGSTIIPNTFLKYEEISEMLSENGLSGCQIAYVNDGEYLIPVVTQCSDEEESESDDIEKNLFIPGIGSYPIDSDTDETEILNRLFGKAASEFKIYVRETGYIAVLDNEKKSVSATPAKDWYDISSGQVVLSLVWRKFDLHPEMFGGNQKVSKDQLCSYLIAQGYPEYTVGRTTFDYESKENKNLLIAILKSSSKGAGACRQYSLSHEESEGTKFRHEVLPWGEFFVSMNQDGKGWFKLSLPKIPSSLLYDAYSFFNRVYAEHGTESALQLFWKPETKEYYWYVPKQYVFTDSVNFERDTLREHSDWLIADVHSHGTYSAFFSSMDNADEKGTRLYGVMGDFEKRPQFLLRAGTGGYFVPVSYHEIFEKKHLKSNNLSIENVYTV